MSAMNNDPDGEWILLDPAKRISGEGTQRATFPLPHSPMDARDYLVRSERKAEYYTLLAELATEFPPVDLMTSLLVKRLGQHL
jgi:hypothetical protein